MTFPSKGYGATKTLGVYYTSTFTAANPTWAAVNDGLPATDVRQFALDPFTPRIKQYLMLEATRTLYRRDNGGNWAEIFTSAEAIAMTPLDTEGDLEWFCTDPSVAGRLWVSYDGRYDPGIGPGIDQNQVYAFYSDDYGATWNITTLIKSGWTSGWDAHSVATYGNTVFVAWSYGGGYGGSCSINKGVTWGDVGASPWDDDGTVVLNPLQPDRIYTSNFSIGGHMHSTTSGNVVTDLDGRVVTKENMWFAAADADHHRIISNARVYVTDDSWATQSNPGGAAIVPAPISFAPWAGADEDQMIVGLVLNLGVGGNRHVIGTLYGEADVTATGKAGAMCDTSPYTNSIPETCGGVSIGGVAFVPDPVAVIYVGHVEFE